MRTRLLAIAVERETDLVLARQRTRQIAGLAGFDTQDQTRITTAVSEIGRNVLEYAKAGRIEYWLDRTNAKLEIQVEDRGPGIADVEAILSGHYRSPTGMGIGILGARRLMEDFSIKSQPGQGTRIHMTKQLPRKRGGWSSGDIAKMSAALTVPETLDPIQEIRRQNQEMVLQMEELGRRQEELEQLNQELGETNRGVVALYAELEERAEHLRRADELKLRFLSNMSHEFRTPLNSILALSRLLLGKTDGDLTAEQGKQVQFIRKSAETLTDLINDLLDLAKVEAGKTVVNPTEFTADSLFGVLRGMLRPLLVTDHVGLVFDEAAHIPPLVSDEGKVSQILRNFISNALKYTERGEVRICAEFDEGADTVIFHVQDTGIGIEPKDIDLIWQEFNQVAHGLQSRVKGTGLGLPLSRKLAILLGGGVSVTSEPGEGSCFSLTIPRIYAAEPGSDEGTNWHVEAGRIPVLVIEDNAADAFSVERWLAGSQYQALSASSVAEARRAMTKFQPAAILMDVLLTGEECWNFLIELRHNEATQAIPTIVLSTTQEERKARSFGADEYFDKPVDPTRLRAALDQLTGRQSIRKVLIVDDEEISRYLQKQLLPRGAFAIEEAATGMAGLERVREACPDVILLDLNLPDMTGIDFIKDLEASPPARSPAIVMVTSAEVTEDQRRQLGSVSDILRKSDITSTSLVAAIDRALIGEVTEL